MGQKGRLFFNKRLLILCVVIVLVMVLLYLRQTIQLSPSSTITHTAPRDPASGAYYFAERVAAKLNAPLQSFAQGIVGDQGAPLCGPKCTTFTSNAFKMKNPCNKGALQWNNFFTSPEVQAEIIRLAAEIQAWYEVTSCDNSNCIKGVLSIQSPQFEIKPSAVANSQSCPVAGHTAETDIEVIGEEVTVLGQVILTCEENAGKKFIEAFNQFVNSNCPLYCGSGSGTSPNCGYEALLSDIHVTPGNPPSECPVMIKAHVKATCTEKANKNDYEIKVKLKACFDCQGGTSVNEQ